jgi:hypothetical protein
MGSLPFFCGFRREAEQRLFRHKQSDVKTFH